MRLTLGTVSSVAALILIALAFWPTTPSGPAAPLLVAQDQPARPAKGAKAAKTDSAETDQTESPSIVTEQKLRERVEVDYLEVPVADLLQDIEVTNGLQIYLNRAALDDVGMPADTRVTVRLAVSGSTHCWTLSSTNYNSSMLCGMAL